MNEEWRGRPPKPLSKDDILSAMAKTKSNRAACRFLGVSYIHYKKWAKLYMDNESDPPQTLFDKHKNQMGRGIPKFLKAGGDYIGLDDILEGRIDPAHFSPQKIKDRLLAEGYLDDKCKRCNFGERRVLDFKVPLLLNFIDNNKKNYKLENLQLLCYNCFFLTVGDIFSNKQLEGLEDFVQGNKPEIEWELDDYQKAQLAKLNLMGEDEKNAKDDDLISYKVG